MDKDRIIHSFNDGEEFSVIFVEEELEVESAIGNKVKVVTEFIPETDLNSFLGWLDDDLDVDRLADKADRIEEGLFRKNVNGTFAQINFDREVVFLINSGIHYVCQHSFDIFPHEIKKEFYNTGVGFGEDIDIGYLYTLEDDKMLVRSSDIHHGFMLTKDTIDDIGKFSDWIRKRNDERD